MSRIAIVGSGVSGLVAAYRLHRDHDVTVFEADSRIGGHVHTWNVESRGREYHVDSGFIVCNDRNYPNFMRLLSEIGVATQPSTMSFSVRHDAARLEYNGSTLRQLFAHPLNAVRPSFYRMLADVLRFNRAAPRIASSTHSDLTLGDVLTNGNYSAAFRDWYIVPMGSAIWSLPASRVLEMPARFFVDFFDNHGMLTVNDRPMWRTVVGGSSRYVAALTAPFRDCIRTNHRVRRVERFSDRVEVDGERFDRVIIACHSDQALSMLADPSNAEREVLGAMPYQANDMVLHTDTTVLPRRRAAWGAWNYRITGSPDAPAMLTYNMNELQALDAADTFCVTLNADERDIDQSRVIGRATYHHPVVTQQGVIARARRDEISGVHRTHFCGAYWGNGFHEDGVVSALAAVREVNKGSSSQMVAA